MSLRSANNGLANLRLAASAAGAAIAAAAASAAGG